MLDDLIDDILCDFSATLVANDGTHPGIEKPQIIVNFRDGPNRGTWISGSTLLANGNGRADALDLTHLGFIDPFQELTGVSGQGLDIATMSRRVECVEGHTGFARPAHSCHYSQTVDGDFNIDILQIVLLGSQDSYGAFTPAVLWPTKTLSLP